MHIPPVLRVGKQDKGLHVIAGSSLTYYYRSTGGSGWFKKSLGYSSDDYDMLVIYRPTIVFYRSEKIYKGDGDTFGNFSVILLDSSYVESYYGYYTYTYSVRGPVSIAGGGLIWYSIYTDHHYSYFQKKGTPVPNSCSYKYGDLEYEYYQYYEYSPCGQRVDDIACEWSSGSFLVYYNPKYECDYIRTYPMNDTIKGLFWGTDICKAGSYLVSAIGQDDRFPYLIHGATYYPVDTVRSISTSSIAAIDTQNIFIAYVGAQDSIVRVVYGSLPGISEEPPSQKGISLLGSFILRDPSQSGGYIRFIAGSGGNMVCVLYRADGTRAYMIAREVKDGEEIRIPVNELGSGVYYLWVRIAGHEKMFRVVVL